MMNRQTSINPMTVTLATTGGDLAAATHNLCQAGLDPTVVACCPDTSCESCATATQAAA